MRGTLLSRPQNNFIQELYIYEGYCKISVLKFFKLFYRSCYKISLFFIIINKINFVSVIKIFLSLDSITFIYLRAILYTQLVNSKHILIMVEKCVYEKIKRMFFYLHPKFHNGQRNQPFFYTYIKLGIDIKQFTPENLY